MAAWPAVFGCSHSPEDHLRVSPAPRLWTVSTHVVIATNRGVTVLQECNSPDKQYLTVDKYVYSTAGYFDLKVFVSCLQVDKDLCVETSCCSVFINSCVLLMKWHFAVSIDTALSLYSVIDLQEGCRQSWVVASFLSSLASLPSYYVNRDTLFSYHKASEEFLHRVMALYVASHYKVGAPSPRIVVLDALAHMYSTGSGIACDTYCGMHVVYVLYMDGCTLKCVLCIMQPLLYVPSYP